MSVFKNVIAMCLGLAGCTDLAEHGFLDWAQLLEAHQNSDEIAAAEIVLRDDIKTICQLSPYTFALSQPDTAYERRLKSGDLLPVGESEYLFAYFDTDGHLVRAEHVPAHAGKIRAARTFEPDYICASVSEARIFLTRSDGIVSFGISAFSR